MRIVDIVIVIAILAFVWALMIMAEYRPSPVRVLSDAEIEAEVQSMSHAELHRRCVEAAAND